MGWGSSLPASTQTRTSGSTPWRDQLRRWIGEDLVGDEAIAFDVESCDRDLRRVRVLAPLMVILHAVHIFVYRMPHVASATLSPDSLRWQQYVMSIHVATLPLALLITAIAFVAPGSWAGRRIAALAAAIYLIHGALATGVDQIAFSNLAAFTGYCFGIAVICGFPLRTSAWVYAPGTAVVAIAIAHFQVDPAARLSNISNAATVTITSVILNAFLYNARRRDFRQRRIIERQHDELASLNTDLERRVDEQVAEIVRRAEEVNQLNAQLRSQIRTRSTELQAALAKLAAQREADEMLHTGDVLGGRFEIARRIGAGGMGVVYAGRDEITGSTVAIKVIRAGGSIELDSMRRFLGEASAVASIVHPAVVRMIHVDISDDGFLYQAQELVDGVTLEQRLDEGPWPETTVARLGSVLCDALAAAHAHGVIHRDVKPANVMLIRNQPGLKLLDFGLAKLYDDTSHAPQHRTGSRLVVGTPAYMAPEQVLAGEITDKADIYAVGVLLFQLLTGRLAFEFDGASKIMMKHVSIQAPDVRAMRADVSDELAELVARCLSKDPVERPTAAGLGLSLSTFADAKGALALEALVAAQAADSAPAEPDNRTTGSIARRMRGFGSVMILAGLHWR